MLAYKIVFKISVFLIIKTVGITHLLIVIFLVVYEKRIKT